MKTNNIPALVTLAAAAVYCIIGLYKHHAALYFAKQLLIVIIIFYVIGSIVKIILDASFKNFGKEEETNEEESEEDETSENIMTDEK